MASYNLFLLPGDGIGPEVMEQAIKVLDRVTGAFGLKFNYREADVGGAGIDRQGKALP